MLCLYILGHNCLNITFWPYLSSETYSRKYEKLPNIVRHACKNMREKKWICWKCLARKFGFVYLRFDPLRRNSYLKSLLTIDTLSWVGGAVVTHPIWVQELPGAIPGSSKGFYVWFCVFTTAFNTEMVRLSTPKYGQLRSNYGNSTSIQS